MGESLGMGDARALNPDFPNSTYAKKWEEFLRSPELRKVVETNTAKVVFFPHANILPYIKGGLFDVPNYIQLGSCEQASIQDYICSASVCITDYSSVAFDAAYLGTPCIYYQFDQEDFFGGSQVYAKGYFDYEQDGFGPVATTQDQALTALQDIIDNDFAPLPQYKQRIDETFIFRDGKCCERIYHAIKALDEPCATRNS